MAGKRHADTAIDELAPSGIAISWVTVGEVYEGAYRSRNPESHLATFRVFLQPFRVLDLNDGIMERFAEIRSSLRRQGTLIPDFDLVLAATALHHDLAVLTFNVRHLSRIPGLKFYPPA